MGFLLFLISISIKIIIGFFSYIFGTIISINNNEWSKYNRDLALSNDRYGNVLCQYLFNRILITKKGYKFGNGKETISSCIGKNKKINTLTFLGKFLDKILDLLDNNHSIESIDNNI